MPDLLRQRKPRASIPQCGFGRVRGRNRQGKRDRKPIARSSAVHRRFVCHRSDSHAFDLAQLLVRRLLVGRTAGTAVGFTLRQDRDLGSILDAAEKIAGYRLKSFRSMLFRSGPVTAISRKSAKQPSLMTESRMQTERDAIFVGDQTPGRTMLQFVPRQRAAGRDDIR